MKTAYPLGLSALLFLGGCSSFMGGRFAGVGERFASLRHRNSCNFVVAEHVEKVTLPVRQLPDAKVVAGDCESMPGTTVVVENTPKQVRVEKLEGERLQPEAAKPPPVRMLAASLAKNDGRLGLAPGLISSDVASEAAEEESVGKPSEDRPRGDVEAAPLQYLRNRRLRMDYEVHGAGQSGVADVELWYTRDGRRWLKADAPTQKPPCLVDFGDEGRFGITLVARNGNGAGQSAPAPGDKPQVWVEIDSTRPDVIMSDIKFNAATRVMSIAWSASDRNLDPRSVCLSYATEADGPWIPIAQNVDNLGKYDWKVDIEDGQRFFIRVQVTDLAGNVGSAKTREPLVVDMAKPTAMITKLEEAR